jgi:hypothetical protein
MDPVTIVIAASLLGGLAIASVVVVLNERRHAAPSVVLPYRPLPISTDVINMAHIKVAGLGGLGLVAMSAVVTLAVPEIFRSIATGLVLGVCLAAALIKLRE